MIGRVFNNRYQLTERIGIGGMAEVYRAQDRVLGRLVAVKVMLPQYASDPEFTQRFRQEAAAAANLQSPYIVNVYDWGQDEGIHYMVMEYVRGSDLKTAITQRGAINQRKVAEIGAQVCKALSVAHNQDIIHRDIKPQNIMVQPDGNVKVMDFGIARAKNSMKQQTSAVLGTAHYISPEQAQGKELTPASDIYSLGVVLYEAATGKLPFDGPDSVSVAMKQVSDAPVPPREVNPDLDPNLEAIILRALEKDPAARFATVNDMKHALNDYLAGRPVSLDDDATHVMSNGTFVPPISNAAGATSVMQPLASDGSPVSGAPSVMRAVDEEEQAKHKKRRNAVIVAIIAAVALLVAAIAFALSGMNGSSMVPDVTGQTAQQAEATLKSAGYTIGTTTEVYDDSTDEGRVVSTDPPAGTTAEKGSAINLNISKGKGQVEVPDLNGMNADQAKQALTKAGLTASQGTAVASDEVAKDKVATQDPAAGTKVEKGSTVTFSLSSGPESVSVPDITGMSEKEAQAALSNAGLTGSLSDRKASDKVAEGDIISQSPSAGKKVSKGSKVSYVISTGPSVVTVAVPNLTGMTKDGAKSALTEKGLVLGDVTEKSSDKPKGTVIEQSTDSSTKVEKGSKVNIVISSGQGVLNSLVNPSSSTTTTS
ncbi:Stk1 family PASTA domain-containing Ser/Thr kinase [Cryptobacterium curtum]|uniref:Stk1 family PASTA domain-containing Ser/Thr kinase n=1 Tax=Cryptobacterium curtum TaxID=84163 RepID=UPI00248DAC20|nr:Stk1 family PASTA domain-containing Ser/Thr kinase [Cryptobacterium curtum]